MKSRDLKWLKELIARAESFEREDDYEGLYQIVGTILDQERQAYYHTKIPDFHQEEEDKLENSFGCFRARKIESNLYKEISKEVDLWAPPKTKKYGRCNLPGQSILYCSNNRLVTFVELGLKKGDLCATARFVADRPEELSKFFTIALGKERKFFEDNPIYNPDALLGLDHELTVRQLKKHRLIERFIVRSFQKIVKENYKYQLTAAISNFYYKEKKNDGIEISGIFYPSVHAQAFNMAFFEEIAKKHMEMVDITAHRIVEVDSDRVRYKNVDRVKGIDDSGNLIWQNGDITLEAKAEELI